MSTKTKFLAMGPGCHAYGTTMEEAMKKCHERLPLILGKGKFHGQVWQVNIEDRVDDNGRLMNFISGIPPRKVKEFNFVREA